MRITYDQQSQIRQLARLAPMTLLGLERVPFRLKALALPRVQDVQESLGDVEMLDATDDDDLIDVAGACRLKPEFEERQIVTDRYIVAGGLCHDHDAPHPLEDGDGNGRVVHRGRRADQDENRDFNHAFGRTADGDVDESLDGLGPHVDAEVVARLAKQPHGRTLEEALAKYRPGVTLLQAVRELRECDLREPEERLETFFGTTTLDTLEHDAFDTMCDCFADGLDAAHRSALDAGDIGEPLAVLLDVYEHGGTAYSLSGGGMQCDFDTTRSGALWIPCQEARDNIHETVFEQLGMGAIRIGTRNPLHPDEDAHYEVSLDGRTWVGRYATRAAALDGLLSYNLAPPPRSTVLRALREEARRYCKPLIEEFTDYVNGNAYGVVVYVIDRKTGRRLKTRDHESWGMIGSQYAEAELELEMLSTLSSVVQPH